VADYKPAQDEPAVTDLDSHAQWVYLEELAHQASHVILAADMVEHELQQVASQGADRVYFALHALVAAAANISRLLWPTAPRIRKPALDWRRRGAVLRALVRADESSVLRPRAVRDHIEHYDERLDDYVASGVRARTDRNVGPIGAYAEMGMAEPQRHFDPDTWELSFGGDHLNVRAARREAERLRDAATQVLSQLYRQ